MNGDVRITSYKTERLSELSRFVHALKPYDDAKSLYDALLDKHVAINKLRLPSEADCPAFIADMVPPRSYAWQQSVKRYGRP